MSFYDNLSPADPSAFLAAVNGTNGNASPASGSPAAQPVQPTPAQPAPTQQPMPQPAANGSTPVLPDYNTFRQSYINAAAAQEAAYPKGLLPWITGSGRDAAVAQATVEAPMAYYKLLGAQAQAQGLQMDSGETAALLRRNGFSVNDDTGHITSPDGVTFDPSKVMQPPQAPQQPGGPQAQPGPPVGGSPVSPGTPALSAAGAIPNAGAPGPVASPVSPIAPAGGALVPTVRGAPPIASGVTIPPTGNAAMAQRRLFFTQAANMMGLPKYMPDALNLINAARAGLPAGTTVDPRTGAIVDANTGAPISGSIPQYNANAAGLVASAQEAPRVAGEIKINNNQAQTSA
jgi:hypothetical protein